MKGETKGRRGGGRIPAPARPQGLWLGNRRLNSMFLGVGPVRCRPRPRGVEGGERGAVFRRDSGGWDPVHQTREQ